jgi:hypothetical protein
MEQEMEQWIDFDEVVDFFTFRGRPYFLSEKLKKQYQANKVSKEEEKN